MSFDISTRSSLQMVQKPRGFFEGLHVLYKGGQMVKKVQSCIKTCSGRAYERLPFCFFLSAAAIQIYELSAKDVINNSHLSV
jgi:hypothetical protein